MTETLPKTNKLKAVYADRLNPRYAVDANAEQKRRQAEAWEALVEFTRRHGGFVTSPPGKVLRIEVPKNSELPAKLAELRFNVVQCGSVTRVTGALPISPRTERASGPPSAFAEMDVLEIRTDGR
jgi:hypothetical protein